MRRGLLLLLVLSAGPTHAAAFHVVATGHFSATEYTNPFGLLPIPEPPPDTTFTLTFDYDAGTPDITANPTVGVYSGAISDMSLTVGDVSYARLPNSLILVADMTASGSQDLWYAQTLREDGSIYWEMSLLLIGIGRDAIQSKSLQPPTVFGPTYFGFISYSIQDRSDPNSDNWFYLGKTSVAVENVVVSEVPAPPVAFLAAGFLPALLFARRGRKSIHLG